LEKNLLYARWSGVVDYNAFERNFDAYLDDVHYQPGRPELIDHSDVSELNINFNLLRSLLRRVNEQSPFVAVETHTVIYSPNDTVYGVGRMYQALAGLSSGIRVEIFQDEQEALSALGFGEYANIASLLAQNEFEPSARRSDQPGNGAA